MTEKHRNRTSRNIHPLTDIELLQMGQPDEIGREAARSLGILYVDSSFFGNSGDLSLHLVNKHGPERPRRMHAAAGKTIAICKEWVSVGHLWDPCKRNNLWQVACSSDTGPYPIHRLEIFIRWTTSSFPATTIRRQRNYGKNSRSLWPREPSLPENSSPLILARHLDRGYFNHEDCNTVK